jgi:predicted nucleic acid-binding protein
MNLVDTSGWIEYFFAEANAGYFTGPIEKTDTLLVPVICLYEVFKKVNIVADEARALQAVAQMKQGLIVDITEDVALSAALVSLKHKLPMADSLIYATALAHGAILWTQDDHFRNLPGVNYKKAQSS